MAVGKPGSAINNMLTEKTANYIIWKLKIDLPDLWERIPKYTNKFPKVDSIYGIVDKRALIVEDMIKNLAKEHGQLLIQFIKDGKAKEAEQMIWGITGLN